MLKNCDGIRTSFRFSVPMDVWIMIEVKFYIKNAILVGHCALLVDSVTLKVTVSVQTVNNRCSRCEAITLVFIYWMVCLDVILYIGISNYLSMEVKDTIGVIEFNVLIMVFSQGFVFLIPPLFVSRSLRMVMFTFLKTNVPTLFPLPHYNLQHNWHIWMISLIL